MSAPVQAYHHPIAARNDYETPDALFQRYHLRYGFTLDAAASDGNAKCPRYFTPAIDGLAQDWERHVVWVNPPYGKQIREWVRKAYESAQAGATVVMLIPARTDSRWWHEYAAKGDVEFLRGRVKFVGQPHNAPFPCAIVVFRPPAERGA